MKKLLFFLFLLTVILVVRLSIFYANYTPYKHGEIVSLSQTLLTDPDIEGAAQKLTIQLPNRPVLFVRLPRYPEVAYGDTIRLSGTVSLTKNNLAFLQKPSVSMENSLIQTLLLPLRTIRQAILSLFQSSLPPTAASLMLGIVFGIKSNMPDEFLKSLQVVGLVHVIAASGMNVTLTAGFFSTLFVSLFKRQHALLIALLSILAYAVLAGLSPSIVRATIMGSILFIAQIMGRQYLALWSLGIAALCMLIYNPLQAFDVGFQLSFAATLGILYLQPSITRLWQSHHLFARVGSSDITTTLAAQIAVTPLLLLHFGSVSLLSVVINAMVLWMVPLLMMLGGVAALVGIVVPLFGTLILYAALPLLLLFENIVSFFRPFAWQVVWETNIFFVAGYYVLLIAVVVSLRKNEVIEEFVTRNS